MEKRVVVRIVFTALSLKEAAEFEEKLEKLLEKYGPHEVEVTALSSSVGPPREQIYQKEVP